MTIRRETDL